jgi:hypothetical protein
MFKNLARNQKGTYDDIYNLPQSWIADYDFVSAHRSFVHCGKSTQVAGRTKCMHAGVSPTRRSLYPALSVQSESGLFFLCR